MTDVFVKTLEETNRNLISNNEDEITMNELLKYRACKKIMSLIKLPGMDLYWEKSTIFQILPGLTLPSLVDILPISYY